MGRVTDLSKPARKEFAKAALSRSSRQLLQRPVALGKLPLTAQRA
jgi:hypothetical protein